MEASDRATCLAGTAFWLEQLWFVFFQTTGIESSWKNQSNLFHLVGNIVFLKNNLF